MRAIVKDAEPHSLAQHRAGQYSDYDNYQDKEELRTALVSEQGGICCYCMGRIRANTEAMKIEHWRSQTTHPDEQLDYRNLLGACMGGEGQLTHLQYCDTKKANLELRWNPANPEHRIESRVKYEADGTIRADDDTFNNQLNQVLNLNLAWLRNNRKGVLTGLLDWWRANRPVPRERIEREIEWRERSDRELAPYCQVAVWWLRVKLGR